jgi:hypothetical protein
MRLPLALVVVVAACARPTPPDTSAAPARAARVPALDSATAHRLCADPERGRAPGRGCVLRDQRLTPEATPLRRDP